jgi:putative polyketide hydroxylase
MWVERKGERISTLDLLRGAFVLIAGPDGGAWIDNARSAASRFPGLQLEAYRIGTDITGHGDDSADIGGAYGLTPSGATLIRPDGFVAWRSFSSGADAELAGTLASILMRA